MRCRIAALLFVLALLLPARPAGAWLRRSVPWPDMVAQAEVIALGHVVGDMVRVENPREGSHVFRGRLAIDEVLKGPPPGAEIPFILHYGLTPIDYLKDGKPACMYSYIRDKPPGLPIYDTGSSAMSFAPIVADSRQPILWFLGHYPESVTWGAKPSETLGVRDPQQLEPGALAPFVTAVLKPAPLPELLPFLKDPDVAVREAALRHFIGLKESGAFPAVAGLLTDEKLASLAVYACRTLGGQDAIPYLRPLLGAKDPSFLSAEVQRALAGLDDTGSLPFFLGRLAAGETGRERATAALALGALGDRTALPPLLAALKDDAPYGFEGGTGREVWADARDALERMTHCRLSPNGDKARRWWNAAKDAAPVAWEHFGIAETVRSLLLLGPVEQESAAGRLHRTSGLGLQMVRQLHPPDHYEPAAAQAQWQHWLSVQSWTDYQAFPSQVDDELAVTIEAAGSPDTGPVLLRYTVVNRSDAPLWLNRHPREVVAMWLTNRSGAYFDRWGESTEDLTREHFVRLAPGERWVFQGHTDVLRGGLTPNAGLRWVAAALRFERKGTHLGLDAWVGDAWAPPVDFGAKAPEGGAGE